MQTITGNTYPVKEKLKAIGARWNRQAQGWDIDDAKAHEARRIVASAPLSREFFPRPDYGRRGYSRFSGGGEMYRNPRGRCEDAPCCGCCS
jgi:hypothetical protein